MNDNDPPNRLYQVIAMVIFFVAVAFSLIPPAP